MVAEISPVWQALLGTLLTWGLTAAGAALVFVFKGGQRKILDGSLGFAAGVMLAASYWSLLAPAIELAEGAGVYGSLVFLPVSVGFLAGALFVFMADHLLGAIGLQSNVVDSIANLGDEAFNSQYSFQQQQNDSVRFRNTGERRSLVKEEGAQFHVKKKSSNSWRRIMLLVVAITVHNIPEGLAVGVGFGAIGKSPSATLEAAWNLALGIGIQNFPEGLAVSLPLRAAGTSTWRSFWYGQLSGMVEPLAGVLGAVAVVVAEPLLPYALAFAAGAMVFVVANDIIPESHSSGNGRLSSTCVIIGFIVMMSLDVGLG